MDRVQIRERALDGAELLAHARELGDVARRAAGRRAVEIIVNRRLDIALALAADGVHLGFDAVPVEVARSLDPARGRAGSPWQIGVSAHSPAEVFRAAADGATYAHLAPILVPLSKPAGRPPLGWPALVEACRAGIPVIAQGGITAERAGEAVRTGAAGVAVSGAILLAEDPGEAAARLRNALDRAAAEA